MQDIDRDIIVQASEGNIEAFEKIYRTTSAFIYNVTYRITNNAEDAQEVTQDVFLKIYNNLTGFRFQSSFKTWLYRVAVNAAINVYKKRSRELRHRADYDDNIELEHTHEKTKESIDRESNEALVESMLNMLNSDQRACVVLRDVEGLSYKEIAGVLKININTVRSRLKRAREALLAFRQKRGGMNNGL